MNSHVNWFDLSLLGASLKVIPISPLRGIAMTCLEVHDETEFAKQVMTVREPDTSAGMVDDQARKQQWWEALKELGFGTRPEVVKDADETTGRSFRLYSDRQSFALSDVQRIAPGVTAEDYRPMPVTHIVHRPEVSADLVGEWKQFAENVLAYEAVSVWVPKNDPFDKPWSEVRELHTVIAQSPRSNRSPLFSADPSGRWFVSELGKAGYRENALVAIYADKEDALAAGYQADDVSQVTLPYALPLWVEKDSRIVALKDVQHIPELLTLPPQQYVGYVADGERHGGMAVALLRKARAIEAIYRAEIPTWRAWRDSDGVLDKAAVNASFKSVWTQTRDSLIVFPQPGKTWTNCSMRKAR